MQNSSSTYLFNICTEGLKSKMTHSVTGGQAGVKVSHYGLVLHTTKRFCADTWKWGAAVCCKVFNDPIHGHMKLHPLLVRIINTPEFQRLRNIKQLGGAYFVYPGASHNRFEHSIGVGYLAGQLATSLKINQPELDISDQDVLCVQIAGLCHDLGHGPFSHLYDGLFISETEPKTKWKHEKASVDMFEYLVENNGLRRVMKEEYGLNTEGENENDLEFIKEMINRTENESVSNVTILAPQYKGRSKEKSFLYDIVSNKETGIDVDKFDYFARDCYHLGFQSNFDHKRFIMFARVCDVDGKKYICSRDKEAANLYDIFHTRHTIHRRACQHRVTKSVEIMIKDALLKANDEIKIEGSEGKLFSLSEAKGDMEAYVKLTDQVVEEISRSTSESLKDAREIIERIMTRKLYWCVGEAKLVSMAFTITMDYGMENTDPISKTYFYKKTKPDRAFKIPKAKVSMLLPEYFSETILRVYWKNPEDGGKEKKKESFNQWCKENNYEVHEEDDEATAGTDQ
uniref:HD/PDEase domain-containing protein n=1 Tax=Amphilophus citrinellus TaxID=61819 RepID=A0A3Q0S0A9_AMPCI